MRKILLLITFFFYIETIVAKRKTEEELQDRPKIGNFSLPTSQQPRPLFGFGQHIVDKHDILFAAFANATAGKQKRSIEVGPAFLYGVTNDIDFLMYWPFAASFKNDEHYSSGPKDFWMQLEYAAYARQKATCTNQITVVGSLLLPSGSDTKNPPTGFGSVSFFLGSTGEHLGQYWYYYASAGALLTTAHKFHNKSGNHFLYQAGLGRNIGFQSHEWILLLMLELNGTYIQKRKIGVAVDENSGGNTIFFGPSLWFSTQRIILQAGIAPIIYEKLFGDQKRDYFIASFIFAWKF